MTITVEAPLDAESVLGRIAEGESLVVRGNPGSGKTQLLLQAFSAALTSGSVAGWSPVMVLTPDRRRAEDFERRAGAARLGSVSAAGGHRLVRSVNSYAYLVVSQWLVERRESLPRPKLFGGADEDAWFAQWLRAHAEEWGQYFPQAVVESEALRMDLRNLVARVGQAGMTSTGLRDLARLADVPLWGLAADAFAEYAGVDDEAYLPTTARLDSARIQVVAARVLRQWEHNREAEGVVAPIPVPRVVLVDDLQDFTPSVVGLLAAMAEAGTQVVAASCEEEATATFRGGQAVLASLASAMLGISTVEITESWRGGRRIGALARAAAQWVRPQWVKPQSHFTADADDASDRPSVSILSGDGRRIAYIADMARSYHYLQGVSWDQQVVIVRASGDIDALRRGLRRRGVPLAPGRRALQLSRIPECAALLRLLAADQISAPESAVDLVTSPLINMDQLELYRFLRSHQQDPDSEPSRDLCWWLDNPQDLPEGQSGDSLRRAATLWSLRGLAAGQPAQQALWTLWEATGLGEIWRQAALQGGWDGEQADERLDAVMALFRRADLWEQQVRAKDPTAAPSGRDFAEAILGEAVVSDSIADVGVRPLGVEVLTVAQAAGREWDVVFVTGLQDGAWPVVSRPGGLLELPRLTGLLAEITMRRSVGEAPLEDVFADRGVLGPIDPLAYRRERRIDEARLLVSAVTRARRQLHLVAVENEDQAASPFLGYLAGQGVVKPFRDDEGKALLSESPRGLDLAGFIGGLRFATIDAERSDTDRKNAARVLASFASIGIGAAHPQNWLGAGKVSTTDTAVPMDDLRIGPSRLEVANQCMLRWFFQSLDGEDQRGVLREEQLDSAAVGTLIHRVAEEHPQGGHEELQEALDRLWAAEGLDPENWWVQRQKAELDSMIDTLASHFARVPGAVQTEVPFTMMVEEATVSGRIDRIEILPDGSARIVDIKTGKSIAPKDVPTHLQLSTYQLALRDRMEVAEAALLAVREQSSKALKVQQPLDDQQAEELRQGMVRLARRMVGPQYVPTVGKGCDTCSFESVCPAKDKGRREVE